MLSLNNYLTITQIILFKSNCCNLKGLSQNLRKSINHLSLHEDIFLEIYWIKLDWRCLWKELNQAKFLKHLLISVIICILFIYLYMWNIMWSTGHLDVHLFSYNLPSPQLKYSLYPSVHIEEFWNKVCTHTTLVP